MNSHQMETTTRRKRVVKPAPNACKSWGQKQDDFLGLALPLMPLEEIAKVLGRTVKAIEMRIAVLGLRPAPEPPRDLRGEMQAYIDQHPAASYVEVGREFGCSPATIARRLKNGLLTWPRFPAERPLAPLPVVPELPAEKAQLTLSFDAQQAEAAAEEVTGPEYVLVERAWMQQITDELVAIRQMWS